MVIDSIKRVTSPTMLAQGSSQLGGPSVFCTPHTATREPSGRSYIYSLCGNVAWIAGENQPYNLYWLVSPSGGSGVSDTFSIA